MNPPTQTDRNESLDCLRGGLLVAMLAVHLVAAHGASEQAEALHRGVGIFLISAGFVALSGYFARSAATPLRGALTAARLLLVMLGFAVIASLLRQGLGIALGTAEGCAPTGWRPPTRLESLGILLPIALVAMLAPLTRSGGGAGLFGGALLSVALAVVPQALGWTADDSFGPVGAVLFRRALTPYYTVSTFLAVGLAGAVLSGAASASWGGRGWQRVVAVVGAGVLASPAVTRWLDPVFALSVWAGALVTHLYWLLPLSLLLWAFRRPWTAPPGRAVAALSLLGRHSLWVFTLHVLLLELDLAVRQALDAPRGMAVVTVMFVTNLGALWWFSHAVERLPPARWLQRQLLVGGTRGALSLWGAAVFAALLAAYSGPALARGGDAVQLADFEQGDRCPPRWTFGATRAETGPRDGGGTALFLPVRPGAFSGVGLYVVPSLESQRTLRLDVLGAGPRSGRLKIELLEDDSGEWELQRDAAGQLDRDDLFALELTVDWHGWRTLALPAAAFRDQNPGRGNDTFDPSRDLTSGGLLQLQLLHTAPADAPPTPLGFDNLRWTP